MEGSSVRSMTTDQSLLQRKSDCALGTERLPLTKFLSKACSQRNRAVKRSPSTCLMPLGVLCSTKRALLYKAPGNTDGTRICTLFTHFRCFIDKGDNEHQRRAALGFNPDARWAKMPFGPASVFLLTVEKALLLTWAFQCLKLGGFNLSFHIQGH